MEVNLVDNYTNNIKNAYLITKLSVNNLTLIIFSSTKRAKPRVCKQMNA